MAYLSELTGKPVTDPQGHQVGVVSDLVARERPDHPLPVIEAVEVSRRDQKFYVSYNDIAVLLSAAVPLKCSLEQAVPYPMGEDDFLLVADVLDKQIIDTDGARVVRVNDVELLRVNGHVIVCNVDVGAFGILRRLGLARLSRALRGRATKLLPDSEISWQYVELLRRDPFMRLRIPVDALSQLHPADVAEILAGLSQTEGGELLESLDVRQAADALEEVEPELQLTLIGGMSDERVADVLEEMAPDEAADLLAELSPERSADILDLMEKDDADDVRHLLAYEEDSAGGLMTTEFASVCSDFTAAQAIDHLRTTARDIEQIFYIYVIGEGNVLAGVFSLSDLVLADPDTLVSEFMHVRVVTASPGDTQENLAYLVSKYNLLAVPVVDEGGCLLGIVTADDALDKIIPTAWKKRLPRFFH